MTLLVALSTLTGCNMVTKNVDRDRATTIATVGDVTITKGELDDYFNAEILSYGYDPAEMMADTTRTESINAYRETLLEQLVDQTVLKMQAEKMNFVLSDEDKENARFTAAQSVESMREQIHNQFMQEADYPTLTTEERNVELERRVEQVQQQQGTDVDGLTATLEMSMINDRLLRSVKGDVTVSEELLNERYQAMMAEQKETFTADASAYESTMGAYEIAAWQPAGFRRAIMA